MQRSTLPKPARAIGRLCLWPIRRVRGYLEPTENIPLHVIAKYLRDDPVIVEAGAADGSSTIQMAQQWPRAAIYAFEPVPVAYDQLVQRTKDNPRIRTIPFAISDSEGSAPMFVSSGRSRTDSSSLLQPTGHLALFPDVEFSSSIDVRKVTLDVWMRDNNVPWVDFLWLDMQGHELAALKSGSRAMETATAIHIEVSRREFYAGGPLYSEVSAFMRDHGFGVARDALVGALGNMLFIRHRPTRDARARKERIRKLLAPSPLDARWAEALCELGLSEAVLHAKSPLDPGRRAYRARGQLYKLVLTGHDSSRAARQQSLRGEFEMVRACKGIPGVPHAVRFHGGQLADASVYNFIDGCSLEDITPNALAYAYVLMQAGWLLFRLSLRGIAHNDVLAQNIIVGTRFRAYLVDFDQASRTGRRDALRANFFGHEAGEMSSKVNFPLRWLVTNTMRQTRMWVLATTARRMITRRFSGLLGRTRAQSSLIPGAEPMPTLSADAIPRLRLCHEAWELARRSNANAPGFEAAYYSIDLEGTHFPGEREWLPRWTLFRSLANYRGKRVLELGCNMALLSCHLLSESGAAEALAVDYDRQILQSAEKVAQAWSVTDKLQLRQINFDSPIAWEEELAAFNPDIVFALNVYNWLAEKDRFMRFLGLWNELIYEGHDSTEVEMQRLRNAGFDEVAQAAISERSRAVLHARKRTAP